MSITYLQGPVLGIGLGIGGEASSVPAVVTGELALQIGGGLGGEGAQEFWAVWAIPFISALHSTPPKQNTKRG